jgi:hypothetical protein
MEKVFINITLRLRSRLVEKTFNNLQKNMAFSTIPSGTSKKVKMEIYGFGKAPNNHKAFVFLMEKNSRP